MSELQLVRLSSVVVIVELSQQELEELLREWFVAKVTQAGLPVKNAVLPAKIQFGAAGASFYWELPE